VADLTAASLLYPLVLPPEAETMIQEMPASLQAFRAGLRDRPCFRWVQEMFRRHRRAGAGAIAERALA